MKEHRNTCEMLLRYANAIRHGVAPLTIALANDQREDKWLAEKLGQVLEALEHSPEKQWLRSRIEALRASLLQLRDDRLGIRWFTHVSSAAISLGLPLETAMTLRKWALREKDAPRLTVDSDTLAAVINQATYQASRRCEEVLNEIVASLRALAKELEDNRQAYDTKTD